MKNTFGNVMYGFAVIAVGATLVAGLSACQEEVPPSNREMADQQNQKAQDDAISRATAAVPVPKTNNFVARSNLAEYMRRMDDPNKVWFVYVMTEVGQVLGYHVGTYPQSVCTFMTEPENVEWRSYRSTHGNTLASAVTTAPALDGVYYGAGGCDTYFMFDETTSSMILLSGLNFMAYDQPLDMDVPALTFSSNEAPGPAPNQ